MVANFVYIDKHLPFHTHFFIQDGKLLLAKYFANPYYIDSTDRYTLSQPIKLRYRSSAAESFNYLFCFIGILAVLFIGRPIPQ